MKDKMKKVKNLDNVILLNQEFICGAFYYAIEYQDYLLKNGFDTYLVLHDFFRQYYTFLVEDKYDLNKVHPDLINKKIYFSKFKKPLIRTKNLFILDGTSFNSSRNFIIADNIFYNYGDDEKSLEKPFSSKKSKINYYIFGDKEMGCIVDYHYPLCLNFEIFKEIKEFENNIRIENKKEKKTLVLDHRLNKDFHKKFNTLKYIENENFWERSNRLIPECKFYGKKIIFEPKTYIDSAQLRFERNWTYYDIWKFKSLDTGLTFAEWVKQINK
jgi:hypothetical protein